ncbi:cortactin-binding protein 2-like [Rhopilema esculentum]|uniref:cortactin-binding protein 2-like n=1 Tax=Rhopilema esculentum TaxID=499914 RepID=UPI0031DE5185
MLLILDSCTLLIAVAAGYGWGFSDADGLVMSDSILDFIGELRLQNESEWISVTEAVKKFFLDKVPWRTSRGLSTSNAAIFQSSVSRFELGSVAWTPTGFPAGITPWTAAWQDRSKPYLTIRLKDETTSTFDSVAYSTSLENTSLQEYCRLIKRYRNVLFMTDNTIEAKHFISCFSHWLKTMDEIRGKTSFIASVEENEICTAQELVKLLREYGALVEVNRERPKCSTIILIDVDFILNRKLPSDVFVWLGKRGTEEPFYLSNGIGVNSQLYYLQNDVIVLAYATKTSMDRFGQGIHRFFKLIDLPPTMPVLLQRWLRQKATRNSESRLNFREIDNWSSWISDVYRRSRIDLEKLDIKLDMPDLGLFLSAPFSDSAGLKSWAEDLWLHHFLPQVESSVEELVAEATNTQQDLLIQVALNAFLKGAFLPGCPCKLDIG